MAGNALKPGCFFSVKSAFEPLEHHQLMILHPQSQSGSQLFDAFLLPAVHQHTFTFRSYGEQAFATATRPTLRWCMPRYPVLTFLQCSSMSNSSGFLSGCYTTRGNLHLILYNQNFLASVPSQSELPDLASSCLCSLAYWKGHLCAFFAPWCPRHSRRNCLSHSSPLPAAQPSSILLMDKPTLYLYLMKKKKAKGNFNGLLYTFHCSEAILFRQALGRISVSSRGSITMKR